MINYVTRRLGAEDLSAFRFIAEVHESLPAAWVDDYVVEPKEVEKTVERLIDKHSSGRIACFIAEHGSEIIAFIWAEVHEQDESALSIFSLWTKPQYRGQGIATTLKHILEDWARTETNSKKIITTVSASNTKMVMLNQKLGYRIMYHKMTKDL